jgi:hypothetical protein
MTMGGDDDDQGGGANERRWAGDDEQGDAIACSQPLLCEGLSFFLSRYFICRNYKYLLCILCSWDRLRTGLGSVLHRTDPNQSSNRLHNHARPVYTSPVHGCVDFENECNRSGPRLPLLGSKKPDQTGLSNTNYNELEHK